MYLRRSSGPPPPPLPSPLLRAAHALPLACSLPPLAVPCPTYTALLLHPPLLAAGAVNLFGPRRLRPGRRGGGAPVPGRRRAIPDHRRAFAWRGRGRPVPQPTPAGVSCPGRRGRVGQPLPLPRTLAVGLNAATGQSVADAHRSEEGRGPSRAGLRASAAGQAGGRLLAGSSRCAVSKPGRRSVETGSSLHQLGA